MTKHQCKQCSKTFSIEDNDQAFYRTMNVPQPTLCPDCRMQRRLAWRNERAIYPRACDLCKKNILAIYPANSEYTVYCHECYWSDAWSGEDYGREYDFSRPFFDQFEDLMKVVPHAAMYNDDPINSEYVNYCYKVKNSYLSFGSNFCEDTLYGYNEVYSKNTIACLYSQSCELCSNCVDCQSCYNTHYSLDCENMRDSYFCYDCKASSNCFGSSGLRHKEFVFFNKQLNQADYEKKVVEYSQKYTPEELQKMAFEVRLTVPQRPAIINKSENSSGNHLTNCSNAIQCYESNGAVDTKYSSHINDKSFDCMDCYGGGNSMQRCYEHITGVGVDQRFCILCWKDTSFLDYCVLTQYAHNCFGCFSLHHVSYAILNRRYSETDYMVMREKIIAHMKETGEFGEFFPVSKSIFGYNETVAMQYFPMKQSDVEQRNWKWSTNYQKTTGQATANITAFSRYAPDVPETILKEVFACIECERNYKILPEELAFYKRQQVWIPIKCYECRFKNSLAQRTGFQIWARQCMCTQPDHAHAGRCTAEFETTYSPDRKELVYCEQCYQKEIL